MKKYICLLILGLLLPTIALATCSDDLEKTYQSLNSSFIGIGQIAGCKDTVEFTTKENNICFAAYTRFEEAAIAAMKTYNTCNYVNSADDYYTKITQLIDNYNQLPAADKSKIFDLNSTKSELRRNSDCAKDLTTVLSFLSNYKKNIINYCPTKDTIYNGSSCESNYTGMENYINKAYYFETAYSNDSCDIRRFHDDYQEYVTFYTAKIGKKYDPAEATEDSCQSEATKMISHLDDLKRDLHSNSCDDSKEISNNCVNKLQNFAQALTKAYQRHASGEFSRCTVILKIENNLDKFSNYYNLIPYNQANGVRYNSAEHKKVNVVRDPVFCPLGDDVTKDLVGVLRIMKIAAPILIFVYSIYEVIQTLTKGEMESKSKELFVRFAKRCAAAILLFAVPTLIDTLMQIFNVWDAEGHCNLNDQAIVVKYDIDLDKR